MLGRDRYIQNKLDKDVDKTLNKDKQLKGEGVEKSIIPSNIIDIYTGFEVLLGLNLSGHTDTLTEASNLIDDYTNEEKYKTNSNIEMLLANFRHKYLQI